MLFRIASLGCKVNQYESEFLRAGLLRLGYVEATPGETASLVVVNTCTVTVESDLKSRKAIRKLAKENLGAELVVMGCAATRDPKLLSKIEGVTEIITDKQEIPTFLRRRGLTVIPKGIEAFGQRHRAFVKVQDGCRVGCSYCIIPKVRPVMRSRPEDDVIEEIRKLSENGYREIVLTGIHLGHYGLGEGVEGRPTLASLVRRIIALNEPFRLRISSLEAVEVTEELIDLMVQDPDRICPHLHLSMQSGSDAVLRNMKRRWMSEPFIRRCEEISVRFDRLALTTDVIVGFPGETDEQFEETCQVVERLGFSKVHIFRFSPRVGTEAATLPHRISPPVQKERAAKLGELAERIRIRYANSLVGMTLPVLFETVHGGTSDRYLDVRVDRPIDPVSVGQVVSVRINRAEGDLLRGTISEHDA